MAALPSAAWLRDLQARANQPPRQPRQPLWAGAATIGSVEPAYMQALPLADLAPALAQQGDGWQLQGDVNASLRSLAEAMRSAGLAGPWRDELLAVSAEDGIALAAVERGAVRPLGIRTQAVHLIGQTEDGDFWVQRRAWDKPNDPGLLDTLMGGMVAASDDVASALARETWEEAGLQLSQLQALSWGGQCEVKRPCADGAGAGYVHEQVQWFRCVLPKGLVPVNQDGEVADFELLSQAELLRLLHEQAFTLEASLVLAAALQS